jgi:hypothetical protein
LDFGRLWQGCQGLLNSVEVCQILPKSTEFCQRFPSLQKSAMISLDFDDKLDWIEAKRLNSSVKLDCLCWQDYEIFFLQEGLKIFMSQSMMTNKTWTERHPLFLKKRNGSSSVYRCAPCWFTKMTIAVLISHDLTHVKWWSVISVKGKTTGYLLEYKAIHTQWLILKMCVERSWWNKNW